MLEEDHFSKWIVGVKDSDHQNMFLGLNYLHEYANLVQLNYYSFYNVNMSIFQAD